MSSKSNSSQDKPLRTMSRTASTEPQVRYISRPVRAAGSPTGPRCWVARHSQGSRYHHRPRHRAVRSGTLGRPYE